MIEALGTWGYKWASQDIRDEHLDPDFLMWALRRLVRVDALPDHRVVVFFTFRRQRNKQFWLVLQRPEGASGPMRDFKLALFRPGAKAVVSVDGSMP